MIRVLFDSTELSNDYIYELTRTHELFDGAFKLGSVTAQTYKLKVDKAGVSNKTPSHVYIKDGNTAIATLQVDNLNEDDKLVYEYDLVDAMVNLNFNYDASTIIGTQGATLITILRDICSQANLTLANSSFNQSSMTVTYYDNTLTARDYVSYMAELNGGYAVINTAGQLELKQFSNTSRASIDINDCENFKLGEQHTITRVLYDDFSGTVWEYGNTNGNTVYLDINNPYITSQSIVQSIYNIINGFSFYCMSVDNAPTVNALVGQRITFTDGNTSYPTILQINQKYGGSMFYGGYELQLDTEQQEETRVISTKSMVRRIKTTLDRDEGLFQREIYEEGGRISTITQRVTSVEALVEDAIVSITYAYAYGYSDSDSSYSGVSWDYTTMPPLVEGKYIWKRTTATTVKGDTTTSTSVTYDMVQGATGGGVGPQGVSIISAEPIWYLRDARLHIELEGNTTQGASPTPSSPQTIHAVSGDNEIRIIGKNFVPPRNTASLVGMTLTATEDGTWVFNGTATEVVYFSVNLELPSGDYAFSANNDAVQSSIYFILNSDDGGSDINCYTDAVNKTKTFTATSHYYRLRIRIPASLQLTNFTVKPQIEAGSTPSIFEPYREQSYLISLGDITLNKLDNTHYDYIYKSDDKWYEKKYISKYQVTGTENWNKSGVNTNQGYYCNNLVNDIDYTTIGTSSSSSVMVPIALCDKFTATYYGNSSTPTGIFADVVAFTISKSSSYSQMRFGLGVNSEYNTKDLFKTYMQTLAPTVYYILATPLDVEITDENLISQLEELATAYAYGGGVTNILQIANDNPFNIDYNETAMLIPSRPVSEVALKSTIPEVWSLTPADYILGYRFYTSLQTHYDDNTVGWSTVVASETDYRFTQYEDILKETKSINAQLQIMSDQITSEVSATTALSTQVTDAQGNIRALQTTTENLQSAINQNSTSIELVVSNTTTLTNDLTNVTETVEDLSTHVIIQADGVKITEGSDDTSYTKIKASGMQIYAEGVLTAEATKDGFNAPKIISGQWVQQSMNNGNSYGFFRKS